MHANLLCELLPPVSYQPQAGRLNGDVAAEGIEHDAALGAVERALNAYDPRTAYSEIARWERVLDVLAPPQTSYQERVQRVLLKLSETGGLSIPYFTQLARQAGYTVVIEELAPTRCSQRLPRHLALFEVTWVWRVHVQGTPSLYYRARANSTVAGERLLVFGDHVIETIFNQLKPAHTLCHFVYED